METKDLELNMCFCQPREKQSSHISKWDKKVSFIAFLDVFYSVPFTGLNKNNRPVLKLGKWKGNVVFLNNGGDEPRMALKGEMSDVNVWDRVLKRKKWRRSISVKV